MIKDKIIELAELNNACLSGFDDAVLAQTNDDLIDKFYKYIDFCFVKQVPDKDFIKKNFPRELLTEKGIFIDRKWKAENLEKCAVMGNSDIELTYNEYNVGRVYVKDSSRVHLDISGNAFVLIDAVNSAKVIVTKGINARVVVRRFLKAEVTGNPTKVIEKQTVTYELHA